MPDRRTKSVIEAARIAKQVPEPFVLYARHNLLTSLDLYGAEGFPHRGLDALPGWWVMVAESGRTINDPWELNLAHRVDLEYWSKQVTAPPLLGDALTWCPAAETWARRGSQYKGLEVVTFPAMPAVEARTYVNKALAKLRDEFLGLMFFWEEHQPGRYCIGLEVVSEPPIDAVEGLPEWFLYDHPWFAGPDERPPASP